MADILSQEEIDALLDVIEDDEPCKIDDVIDFLNKHGKISGDVTNTKVTYNLSEIKSIVTKLKDIANNKRSFITSSEHFIDALHSILKIRFDVKSINKIYGTNAKMPEDSTYIKVKQTIIGIDNKLNKKICYADHNDCTDCTELLESIIYALASENRLILFSEIIQCAIYDYVFVIEIDDETYYASYITI